MRVVKPILQRGLQPGIAVKRGGRVDIHTHCLRPRDPRSPQDHVARNCTAREGVAVVSVDVGMLRNLRISPTAGILLSGVAIDPRYIDTITCYEQAVDGSGIAGTVVYARQVALRVAFLTSITLSAQVAPAAIALANSAGFRSSTGKAPDSFLSVGENLSPHQFSQHPARGELVYLWRRC